MRILCTNDDGIGAAGLAMAVEACEASGEVVAVAPDREQSATSHSLSLFRALRPQRRGPRRWQVDGTPTDCVLLGLGALSDARPEFVMSGVNHGSNMGEDVFYSGTVAAAMEALSQGVSSVAISYASHDVEHLGSYRDLLKRLVGQLVAKLPFPQDMLLNINLPPIPAASVVGAKVTTLGNRNYAHSLTRMVDPWGSDVYWIGGREMTWTGGPETDFGAISEGYISITPLHVDLTSYAHVDAVRAWSLRP